MPSPLQCPSISHLHDSPGSIFVLPKPNKQVEIQMDLDHCVLNAICRRPWKSLEIRCSRILIVVNIIREDDSINEVHLKRLRSVIPTCSRYTV